MASYNELVDDLCRYTGREPEQDLSFAAAIPKFFENAQRRIATEIDLSGLHGEQGPTDFVPGSTLIVRPENAFTINYVEVRFTGGSFRPLRGTTLAWLKAWREFQAGRQLPRYYALYDHNNLYVAPVPDGNMQYRLGFRRIDDFLGPAVSSSYLSRSHPELVMAAAMVEAVMFGKEDRAENQTELAKWEGAYQQRKAAAIANEVTSNLSAILIGAQVKQT